MPPMPAIGIEPRRADALLELVAQVVDVVRRHQQVVGAERRHLGVVGPVDDGGDRRRRAVGAHEARDRQRRVEDHRIADVLVPVVGAALRIAGRVEQERLGDHQLRRHRGGGRVDHGARGGVVQARVERRVVAADQRLRPPQADRVDRVVGVDRADDHVVDAGGRDARIVADRVDVAGQQADRVDVDQRDLGVALDEHHRAGLEVAHHAVGGAAAAEQPERVEDAVGVGVDVGLAAVVLAVAVLVGPGLGDLRREDLLGGADRQRAVAGRGAVRGAGAVVVGLIEALEPGVDVGAGVDRRLAAVVAAGEHTHHDHEQPRARCLHRPRAYRSRGGE
jgi:hypothetical protein